MLVQDVEPGDIVYGPYPYGALLERKKLNHYCFVICVDEDNGMMFVAGGTSSGLDTSPHDHEFQVDQAKDMRALKLRDKTRFDMTECSWVSVSEFLAVSSIKDSNELKCSAFRALKSGGHL